MDEIIIYQPWGGLGDNLTHSPIPEMCHNLGIKCYLSNQNACRNQEIYDFIWGKNPYLLGKKDSTDMWWMDTPIKHLNQHNRNWNNFLEIQVAYKLEPKFHYGKIYYKPKFIKELENTSVFDFCTYSFYTQFYNCDIPRNIDNLNKCVYKLIEKYKLDHPVNITHNGKYTVAPKLPFIKDINNDYHVNSLEHYCDVMFSCKNYISVTSGQSCLASTVKNIYKNNTNLFMFATERFIPPTNYSFTHFKNTTHITLDTYRILPNVDD